MMALLYGEPFLVFNFEMYYIFEENSFTVIRKVIILFIFLAVSCSSPPTSDEEIHVPATMMLAATELNEDELAIVNGMLFDVEDFDKWMEAYGDVSQGLIIAFRNVDDPNLTLVFEGSKTREVADERVFKLSSDSFLNKATVFEQPLSSFYTVTYLDKDDNPPDHFLALSYASGGNPDEDWGEFVNRNSDFFKEHYIEPAGIGVDPELNDRAYLLFRQYDFVESRKLLNSPRKINKFLEKSGLPEQTMISYWVRISQSTI